MSGNLCRCGAYAGITEAVLEAQRELAAAERKERGMNRFDYVRPATIAEAVAAAAEPGAAYLAAGTNLLDLMKGGIAAPAAASSTSPACPGSTAIEHAARMAACASARCVRNADLAHDRDFARRFPAVAEALLSGASAQLRNAATVGGNLLQRTRCAYFYDPASACNKREPGAGCDARGGENRLHAVLGWSEQLHRHPSVRFLRAARGARRRGRDRGARRAGARCRWKSFHRLPGDTPERESVLEPGELIVAVRLPARGRALRRRMPATSSCASAPPTPSRWSRPPPPCGSRPAAIAEARLGARRRRAEALARARGRGGAGRRSARMPRAFRRAAEAALADATPSGDNAFKIELARRIVARALALAAAGTPERVPALPASPFAPFPELRSMPETAPTQAPAHRRHGSNIGQPLTRRDGLLKVTGGARYAADNHPPGMLHAVLAVSSIARGRVTFLDVAAAKAHPGVVEVMTPGEPAAAGAGSGREDEPVHVPPRRAAERPGALRQPADRRGHRRDAGGRDRRRAPAGAAL